MGDEKLPMPLSHAAKQDRLRMVGLTDYFQNSGSWNDFCSPVGTDDFECH